MNLLAHSLLLVDFVYVTCVVGKLLELLFGSSLEESVVELHDVSLRTIVGIERRRLYVVARKLLAYVVEQSPIARTPTIDALLNVAHYEASRILRHTILQQHFEIVPLRKARVLELVNHDVAYLRAYLLVDEGSIACANHRVEQSLSGAKRKSVCQSVHLVNLILYRTKKSQLADVANGVGSRFVATHPFLALSLGFVEHLHQLYRHLLKTRSQVTLLNPSAYVFGSLLSRFVEMLVVVNSRHRLDAVGKLFEISASTTLATLEVGKANAVGLHKRLIVVVDLAVFFLSLLHDATHKAVEILEEIGLLEHLI